MRNTITMKTSNIAATTVLTLAALSVGTATAGAQPPTPNRPTAARAAVGYPDANRTAGPAAASKKTNLSAPTARDSIVVGTMGERNRPTISVNGSTAARSAGPHQGAVVVGPPQSIDATADFDNAVGNMANELGVGIPLGALAGTAIGGGVGCVAGAAVGAALMPPIFLPGAAGGCLAGLAAGAAIGAAVGTVVVGVPVTVAGGVKFFNSIYGPGVVHTS